MRILGVSMVRNEEDIVEAFVRHNLTVLDGLIVVDHGSADRTLEIVQALCAERLPVALLRSDAVGYLQSEITTTAARDAFTRFGADAVFALDADEFLRVPSRSGLEAALAALPHGHHAWVAWREYVPPDIRAGGEIVGALRSSRLVPPPKGVPASNSHKVALTRHFADDPRAMLTMGNHDVLLGRHAKHSPRMPHVVLPLDVAEIAHVPVRSSAQFVVKTTVKRLARVAAGRDYAPGTSMWAVFDALKRGASVEAIDYMASRPFEREATAGQDTGDTAAAAHAAPIVADMALRYTSATPTQPLPLVASAVERLVRALVAARARKASASRPELPGA